MDKDMLAICEDAANEVLDIPTKSEKANRFKELIRARVNDMPNIKDDTVLHYSMCALNQEIQQLKGLLRNGTISRSRHTGTGTHDHALTTSKI